MHYCFSPHKYFIPRQSDIFRGRDEHSLVLSVDKWRLDELLVKHYNYFTPRICPARLWNSLPRDRLCFLSGISRFAMRRLAIIVPNLIALTDNKRWLLSAINLSIKHAPCPKLLGNRWFLDAARDGPREMQQSIYVLRDYSSRIIIMSLEALRIIRVLLLPYFSFLFGEF